VRRGSAAWARAHDPRINQAVVLQEFLGDPRATS